MINSDDAFNNAKAYEGYVGRWSRLVAARFIDWLEAVPGGVWLDVGAGTGILTQVILQQASPAKVIGVDTAQGFIEFAQQHIHDERAEFKVGDAVKIAYEAPEFDAAVAGLVLNFVPSPEEAAKGMAQAVKSGGIVAAYVWDYGGKMEMMRHFWDAAIAVDPTAAEADAGQRFAICKPENLHTLFESIGLQAVDVMPIDVPTHFKDFEDFWMPFRAAQGSVSKYLRSLSDETRDAVRDQLRKQLPIEANGGISLIARAWAVKGKKSDG